MDVSSSASNLFATGPFSHRFLDANGARLHAVTANLDPDTTPDRVVILLHSYPQHWYAWRHVLAAAPEIGLPLVALDLRGHGASDKPPSQFALPTLAADVAGVISTLGAREAILVGHGLGGVVARGAAARVPESVTRVITVSSPHPATWQLHRSARLRAHLAYLLAPQLPERGHTRGTAVATAITELTEPTSPVRELAASYATDLRSPFAARCVVEQLRWLIRARRRPSGRQFLAELERAYWIVPVTELYGEAEQLFATASFADDARCVPGGHFLPEENPEPIISAIAAAATERE